MPTFCKDCKHIIGEADDRARCRAACMTTSNFVTGEVKVADEPRCTKINKKGKCGWFEPRPIQKPDPAFLDATGRKFGVHDAVLWVFDGFSRVVYLRRLSHDINNHKLEVDGEVQHRGGERMLLTGIANERFYSIYKLGPIQELRDVG